MLEMSQVRAKVAVRISLQEMRDRRLKRAEHRRADEERNLHRLVVAPEPDRETRRAIAPGAVREGDVSTRGLLFQLSKHLATSPSHSRVSCAAGEACPAALFDKGGLLPRTGLFQFDQSR